MSTQYVDDDDDNIPFNVDDEEIEIDAGEAHAQEKGDVLNAGKSVLFFIKKAEKKKMLLDNRREQSADNPRTQTKIKLHLKVGPDGVDGKGLDAGKMTFPEFVVAFDLAALERQAKERKFTWDKNTKLKWENEKRFPWIQLMTALGQFDPADKESKPPKINEAFLIWLSDSNEKQGQKFYADVTRRPAQVNQGGKWVDSGEDKNELKNFKRVPPATVDESLL